MSSTALFIVASKVLGSFFFVSAVCAGSLEVSFFDSKFANKAFDGLPSRNNQGN